MQFQYNPIYKTPQTFNGVALMSDPSTVVMLEGDEHYGKTFKEIYEFSDNDVAEFVTQAKWVQVREYRDAELKASDWTQGADVPDNIKQPWAAYRAALRDIPTQFETPDDVVFPDRPE